MHFNKKFPFCPILKLLMTTPNEVLYISHPLCLLKPSQMDSVLKRTEINRI